MCACLSPVALNANEEGTCLWAHGMMNREGPDAGNFLSFSLFQFHF